MQQICDLQFKVFKSVIAEGLKEKGILLGLIMLGGKYWLVILFVHQMYTLPISLYKWLWMVYKKKAIKILTDDVQS